MTEDETRRHFPCDDLVDAPALEAWRAVDVAAAVESVWPWVTQVRVAPHSDEPRGVDSSRLLLEVVHAGGEPAAVSADDVSGPGSAP